MTQKSNYEVELRGDLSLSQKKRLVSFLQANAKFIGKKKRLLIDYSTFIKGQELETRTKDIRLRSTNKITEAIIKIGKWGGKDSRQEISIKFKNKFDDLVQLFGLLGYEKGMLCERVIDEYQFRNILFAIVALPDKTYYFEAEIVTTKQEMVEKIKQDIRKVCASLGLSIFSDLEYFDYIKKLNGKINKPFLFSQYKPGDFNKIYKI